MRTTNFFLAAAAGILAASPVAAISVAQLVEVPSALAQAGVRGRNGPNCLETLH